MNRRMILYTVCVALRMEALVMVPALILALARGEQNMAFGFAVSMALLAAAGTLTRLRKPSVKEFYARDGFFIVAIGWILVALFGALPYFFSGTIPNFIDCIFESFSGFTTTAATVVKNVEVMPLSFLFWRSFSLWLGGIGVLAFLMAAVPFYRSGGSAIHVFRAESPGMQMEKVTPRARHSARILFLIYVGFTLTHFILLLAGGLPLFDSLMTALGTAGTGGFGVRNDSMAGYSMYTQAVTAVFMIAYGVNFQVFYFLLLRDVKKALKNQELWLYLIILSIAVVVITINVLPMFGNAAGLSAHHAVFQASSMITTTGFTTADTYAWPQFSRTLLMILMALGACAGSTGGGVKIARVLILAKAFVRDLRRMVRPRSVPLVRVNGEALDEDAVRGTRSFLIAYLFITILSVVLVSWNGFALDITGTAVIASLNNVGAGLHLVTPMRDYAAFSGLSKLALSACMMLGRLEIFPVLMLLMPSAWRKQ